MASKEMIATITASIKTLYPYYAKDTNVTALNQMWGTLLKEFPDEAVKPAFEDALQGCKFPPTPAEVIDRIRTHEVQLQPSAEEFWGVYIEKLGQVADQMTRFGYTFRENGGMTQGQKARAKVSFIYDTLPENIRRYVASEGELMRLAREYNEDTEFAKYEKPRFLKAMPIIRDRIEYSNPQLMSNLRYLNGGTE